MASCRRPWLRGRRSGRAPAARNRCLCRSPSTSAGGSHLRLGVDSRMSVRAPYSFDTGATFRLTQGRVDVDARGGHFLVESYREVPHSLRLALINMRLSPIGTPSLFKLVFAGEPRDTS